MVHTPHHPVELTLHHPGELTPRPLAVPPVTPVEDMEPLPGVTERRLVVDMERPLGVMARHLAGMGLLKEDMEDMDHPPALDRLAILQVAMLLHRWATWVILDHSQLGQFLTRQSPSRPPSLAGPTQGDQ